MTGSRRKQYRIMLAVLSGLCLLLSDTSYSQYENIWMPAGIDFNGGAPAHVPVPPSAFSEGGMTEAQAMVCDENGDLLMVTGGNDVWDKNYNLMPNGQDLLAIPGYPESTESTMQGTVIVPMPGSQSRYYIFSLSSLSGGSEIRQGYLYYSIVDMQLNDGLGDVEPANKGIVIDSGYIEGITAVVGDRCNIWLLAHAEEDGALHAYEITETGINLIPVTSPLAIPITTTGHIKVAPNRKKLVAVDRNYHLADFDIATGIVSNVIDIIPVDYYSMHIFTVEFSPDSKKLYGYSPQEQYSCQYDLTAGSAAEIYASRVNLVPGRHSFKRGPDGKIYFGELLSGLSRFNQPNQSGLACDYQPGVLSGGVYFSTLYYGGPNVVAYMYRDTLSGTKQAASGPCFANVTGAALRAVDDTSGWDYLWNTGAPGETLAVQAPGTYWVSYHTPPCVFNVDTFHVTFPNGVLPAVQIDTACAGTANGRAYAATYPGDTVHYTYTWLSGADTLSLTDTLASVPSGNYTLLVHTINCDTSLNVVIPEVDYQVSFTSSDTLICMGVVLEFQNTSDDHFNQFTWYSGDGDSSLLAEPAGHTYAHAGSYDILLTGSGPICNDTARRHLTVDSLFSAAFTMDQGSVCVGDAVRFRLADANITFTGLQWDWGDDSYLQAAYENSFSHAFDHPGTFPIQVTLNARACPDTFFTDTVWVYALPEVNLGGDTSLCLDGQAVVLHNLADAPNEAHHYLWSTGDTTAGLRVLQPGSYSLRITTAPLGCNTTDAIEVTKDCYVDIPNAFTPNGDGENDYFFPRTELSKSVSDFRMQVFNRWGQLLFETANIAGRGWDGRFNDQGQPMGVYIYLVDVAYSNGRQEQYEGNVTLVR